MVLESSFKLEDGYINSSILRNLNENGFAIIKQIISKEEAKIFCLKIKEAVNLAANQIQYPLEEYLSVVSNWQHPSPITSPIERTIHNRVQERLRLEIHPKVESIRFNIIYRNKHSKDPVACHQDISYYPEVVYPFSTWLSFNDVNYESSALEVLPKSHLGAIEPPIDFLEPSFSDPKRQTDEWNLNAISLPISAGDAIILDSRIWHGSSPNVNGVDRIAAISRWKLPNFSISCIPPRKKVEFGMWNCKEVSHLLLREGLLYYYGIDETDFLSLINIWKEKISYLNFPFSCNRIETINSLEKLKLHLLAQQHHNGIDASGYVYRSVWDNILKKLTKLSSI